MPLINQCCGILHWRLTADQRVVGSHVSLAPAAPSGNL